jgi:hypothetical protein
VRTVQQWLQEVAALRALPEPAAGVPRARVHAAPAGGGAAYDAWYSTILYFSSCGWINWEKWNFATRGNIHGKTLSAVSFKVEGEKRTLLVNFTHRLWLKDAQMKELMDMFQPTHVVLRLREDLRGAEDSGCTWLEEGDSSQKLVLREARRKGWDVDG